MSKNTPQIQYVTVAQPKKANHILHLLLSVITCGLWLPVWLLVSLQLNMKASLGNRGFELVRLASVLAFAYVFYHMTN